MSVLYITMQRLSALLTCSYSIDGKFRSCKDVSTHEDILFGSLISEFVGHRIDSADELYLCTLEQVLKFHSLADSEDDQIGLEAEGLLLVVFRSEAMVLVKDGSTFLKDDSLDLLSSLNFHRTPAREYSHTVLTGLCSLERRSWHNILSFKG